MSMAIRRHLQQNFDRIGPLTDAQFLATKALSKKMIYAQSIDFENISITDVMGGEHKADAVEAVNEFEHGVVDSLKIRAKVRGMTGGAEQVGNIKLDNIIDIKLDSAIGILVIENDKCVFTNIPCWTEIEDLVNVIKDPNNWVDRIALSELLPPDVALCDFVAVRELQARTIGRGVEIGHAIDRP